MILKWRILVSRFGGELSGNELGGELAGVKASYGGKLPGCVAELNYGAGCAKASYGGKL